MAEEEDFYVDCLNDPRGYVIISTRKLLEERYGRA